MEFCCCEENRFHARCFMLAQVRKVYEQENLSAASESIHELLECSRCGSQYRLCCGTRVAKCLVGYPNILPHLSLVISVICYLSLCQFDVVWKQAKQPPENHDLDGVLQYFVRGIKGNWLFFIFCISQSSQAWKASSVIHLIGDPFDRGSEVSCMAICRIMLLLAGAAYGFAGISKDVYFTGLYLVAFCHPLAFPGGDAGRFPSAEQKGAMSVAKQELEAIYSQAFNQLFYHACGLGCVMFFLLIMLCFIWDPSSPPSRFLLWSNASGWNAIAGLLIYVAIGYCLVSAGYHLLRTIALTNASSPQAKDCAAIVSHDSLRRNAFVALISQLRSSIQLVVTCWHVDLAIDA